MIFSDFYLNRVILELRYDDGFLYWDNCGATLLEIRRHFPEWELIRTDVELAVLKEKRKKMEVSFNYKSIRFFQDEVDNLNQFKEATKEITSLILEKLQINKFSRVGNRFFFHLPLHNIKEGETIIQKSRFVELDPKKVSLFEGEPYKYAFTVYLKNKDRQFRIELTTVERLEPIEITTTSEKFNPKYGLRADIDIAITKEERALGFSIDSFVQSNYKFLEANLTKLTGN